MAGLDGTAPSKWRGKRLGDDEKLHLHAWWLVDNRRYEIEGRKDIYRRTAIRDLKNYQRVRYTADKSLDTTELSVLQACKRQNGSGGEKLHIKGYLIGEFYTQGPRRKMKKHTCKEVKKDRGVYRYEGRCMIDIWVKPKRIKDKSKLKEIAKLKARSAWKNRRPFSFSRPRSYSSGKLSTTPDMKGFISSGRNRHGFDQCCWKGTHAGHDTFGELLSEAIFIYFPTPTILITTIQSDQTEKHVNGRGEQLEWLSLCSFSSERLAYASFFWRLFNHLQSVGISEPIADLEARANMSGKSSLQLIASH
eukprot:scaffold2435_cov121-Cylindrotheca_fusiformis.AAC.7